MSIEALSIVLNHSQAKGAAKLVLIGIANHLGPDADEGAWPSQGRLAGYANISDRAVRDCIETLERLGELTKEHAGGLSRNQYKPNRYWITLRCPETCDGSLGHNRVEVFSTRQELSDNQGGTFEQSGWKPTSDKPLLEPEKKQSNAQSSELFDEFWTAYPRKLDKAKAFRAFKSALKRASFEDILAGVLLYRSDPKRDPEFTKYPATWLNSDSWENTHEPSKDSEAARRATERRERERAASEAFLAEQRAREQNTAPAPKCVHDLNVALCKKCLQ
jgi:hypothetical protein